MARTNIVIDEELIKEVQKITGAKSKREAVDLALRNLVRKDSLQRSLRKLRGKLSWQGNIDRSRRSRE